MIEEEKVFAAIRRNLLMVLPELESETISAEHSLADLGCNSIDRAEIVTMTMEELDVTVPIIEFAQVHNIRTLAALLRRYL